MANSLPVNLQSTITLDADLQEAKIRDIRFLITHDADGYDRCFNQNDQLI